MPIWNVKTISTVIAGVSASAIAARKALGREVDKRADDTIEQAVEEARAEIRNQAKTIFTKGFRNFVQVTLVKALIVLCIAILFLSGFVEPKWLAIVLGALFLGFFCFDTARTYPNIRFLAGQVRRFGWKPKAILSGYVSAQVFERVLERAQDVPQKRSESVLMLLAGRKKDELVERIAKAVADITATATWDDIKPFCWRYLSRFVIGLVLYSSLVWGVIYLLRAG